MPKISEFFGVSVHMYWREHGPSHFHAVYGEGEAVISIDDLRVLTGALSPRVLGLVIEWATLHQDELAGLWERAQNLEPLGKIDPLE